MDLSLSSDRSSSIVEQWLHLETNEASPDQQSVHQSDPEDSPTFTPLQVIYVPHRHYIALRVETASEYTTKRIAPTCEHELKLELESVSTIERIIDIQRKYLLPTFTAYGIDPAAMTGVQLSIIGHHDKAKTAVLHNDAQLGGWIRIFRRVFDEQALLSRPEDCPICLHPPVLTLLFEDAHPAHITNRLNESTAAISTLNLSADSDPECNNGGKETFDDDFDVISPIMDDQEWSLLLSAGEQGSLGIVDMLEPIGNIPNPGEYLRAQQAITAMRQTQAQRDFASVISKTEQPMRSSRRRNHSDTSYKSVRTHRSVSVPALGSPFQSWSVLTFFGCNPKARVSRTKSTHLSCLTCIRYGRRCIQTEVVDGKCANCRGHGGGKGARCRTCYWPQPGLGISKYEEARAIHGGRYIPSNTRVARERTVGNAATWRYQWQGGR